MKNLVIILSVLFLGFTAYSQDVISNKMLRDQEIKLNGTLWNSVGQRLEAHIEAQIECSDTDQVCRFTGFYWNTFWHRNLYTILYSTEINTDPMLLESVYIDMNTGLILLDDIVIGEANQFIKSDFKILKDGFRFNDNVILIDEPNNKITLKINL